MKTNNLSMILFLVIFSGILSCKKSEEKPAQNQTLAELEYEIKAKLGEGAFWNHKTQELYWVDIVGNQFHIYNPSTKMDHSINMPSSIGTVVPYTNEEAIVALADGIYKVDIKSGELELVSNVESDIPENRFNDGKCGPNGNLWVGSIHYNQLKYNASLYKVEENGITTKMIDSVTNSNGIVWTKDSKTMYYIDTPTFNIKAYDFNVETSTISNERIAVKVSEEDGFPDGMAIDEEDMLWVGMWNGKAVARFNPKTGKLISKINVPAVNITSCAFGGENLDELYITTSNLGMTDAEVAQYPLAGSIFKVKPGVKGVKSAFFGKKNN